MDRRRLLMLQQKQEGLPEGYTQVNYLESTGTQYIDTEISAARDLGVKINFVPKSSGQAFGAITSLNKGYYGVEFSPHNRINIYWGIGMKSEIPWGKGVTYEIDFNYQNSGVSVFNGAIVVALPSSAEITENSVHLFKLNEGSTHYTQYISGRAYRMRMTKELEPVLDFIPALDPNGIPCMYDVVRKKTFYNAGTGDFLWG